MPCVFFSNTGFDRDAGVYTIQQDGVYAVDYSIVMNNADGMTLNASLITNTNFTADMVQQSYGAVKTMRMSGVFRLKKGDKMSTSLQTGGSELKVNTTLNGGFSVYFLQSTSDAASK